MTATNLEDEYRAARNDGNTANFVARYLNKTITFLGVVSSVKLWQDTDGTNVPIIYVDTHRPNLSVSGMSTFFACTPARPDASASRLRRGFSIVPQGTMVTNDEQDSVMPGELTFEDCHVLR